MDEILTVEVDLSALRHAIGGGSYKRGSDFARRKAVRSITGDPVAAVLRGTVRDERGQDYHTAVAFSVADGCRARFAKSRCGCEIKGDCKHVVALVLSALPAGPAGLPAWPAGLPAWPAGLPAWPGGLPGPRRPAPGEQSFQSQPSSTAGDVARLAIELRLTGGPGRARRLEARLTCLDQCGYSAGDDLSWGNLDAESHLREYGRQQVQLLRDLYRLYLEPGGNNVYGYDRSINFSAIGTPQLWPLLDRAVAAGLALVYQGTADMIPAYREARFHLDLTIDPDDRLRIMPVVLTSDGEAAVPVAFIGANGQGAVCVDRAEAASDPESWRFWLARLAKPVPPELHEMALADRPMEVPADEEFAFRELHFPWLLRNADLISSDGSFVAPKISGPELVLRLCCGPSEDFEVSWGWAYQVGDSRLLVSLERVTGDEEYRRPAAERALLAGLDLPAQCSRLGFHRRPGGQIPLVTPRTHLTGPDTTRFIAGLLPRLAAQPGLIIEFSDQTAAGEAGGSVWITVSTDEVAGNKDWFDLDVTVILEGYPVPFRDVFLALNRGDLYLERPGEVRLTLDRPELRALARLIRAAGGLNDSGPARTNRPWVVPLKELAAGSLAGDQAPTWREQVGGLSAGSTSRSPAEPPAGLRDQLHPHQLEGFRWLAFLWENRLGGILADEMGLGKTLQCLALISYARQQDPAAGPFLIVARTSVMANWVAEAFQFTPELKVVPATAITARLGRSVDSLAAGADAVVTTYDVLWRDFDAYAKLTWSGLLLDEAQRVKNPRTVYYKCALQLEAKVKIAITGTPLENNLKELWSLLSITAPGAFPSQRRFFASYARPIEDQDDRERLAQLKRRIKPLVMRRTKDQVAVRLPAKQEQVVMVDLHAQHHLVYQMWLQRERQ